MPSRIVETIHHERDFKVLCDGLLRFELGQLVQTYGSAGPDGGVDAEFKGTIDGIKGRWVFQYKFRSPIEAVSRRRSWLVGCYTAPNCRRAEFDKPGVADADGYVLLTNTPVTVGLVRRLADAWSTRKPNAPFCVWDPSRLNALMKGREHLARSWTGAREAHCRSVVIAPLWSWIEGALSVTTEWQSDPLWPLALEGYDERKPRPAFNQSFAVRHGIRILPRLGELAAAKHHPVFRYAVSIAYPNAFEPFHAVGRAVESLSNAVMQEVVGLQQELLHRLPQLGQLRGEDPQEVSLALAYCVLEARWGFPARGLHSIRSGKLIVNGTLFACNEAVLDGAEPMLDELVAAVQRGVVPEMVAIARAKVEEVISSWAERMYEVVTFGIDADLRPPERNE